MKCRQARSALNTKSRAICRWTPNESALIASYFYSRDLSEKLEIMARPLALRSQRVVFGCLQHGETRPVFPSFLPLPSGDVFQDSLGPQQQGFSLAILSQRR